MLPWNSVKASPSELCRPWAGKGMDGGRRTEASGVLGQEEPQEINPWWAGGLRGCEPVGDSGRLRNSHCGGA